MLGINYTGQLDDFAIFNVGLSDRQIQSLIESEKSVLSIIR